MSTCGASLYCLSASSHHFHLVGVERIANSIEELLRVVPVETIKNVLLVVEDGENIYIVQGGG